MMVIFVMSWSLLTKKVFCGLFFLLDIYFIITTTSMVCVLQYTIDLHQLTVETRSELM